MENDTLAKGLCSTLYLGDKKHLEVGYLPGSYSLTKDQSRLEFWGDKPNFFRRLGDILILENQSPTPMARDEARLRSCWS